MPESDFRRYVALGGATIRTMVEDAERCYRVVISHDGWFYAVVDSTRVLSSLRTSGFERGLGARARERPWRTYAAPVGKPRKNTGRTS